MPNTFSDRTPDMSGLHGRTDWRAAILAGVIAGVVFVIVEMLLVWLVQGMSPWAPPRMMAAMILGPEILPPPADFSLMALVGALVIHFPLSIVYGLILGWVVHRLEMLAAVLVGAAFGLIAVYAINFYVIAPMAFPWFVEAQNWVSALAHAIFGAVLGGSYVAMRRD